jgi:hypothetical protein
MKVWPCIIWGCLCFRAEAVAHDPVPTAIFPFELDDTSLQGQEQGPREDQRTRLAALDQQFRDALLQSGCCSAADLRPVAKQVQTMDLRNCNGCEVSLARRAGAVISVTGWVQKVSNLILNINVVARDVTTGKVKSAASVDIRGNTDESWSRGLSYLLRNRLHPSEWSLPSACERRCP